MKYLKIGMFLGILPVAIYFYIFNFAHALDVDINKSNLKFAKECVIHKTTDNEFQIAWTCYFTEATPDNSYIFITTPSGVQLEPISITSGVREYSGKIDASNRIDYGFGNNTQTSTTQVKFELTIKQGVEYVDIDSKTVSYANNGTGTTVGSGTSGSGSTTVGGLNYGAGAGNTSFSGFQDYMNTVLPWIMSIGVALSILMIVYGGFKYITSQGQPDQLTAAKNIIFSTIIGFILLVMMSYILDIFLQRM